jgi:hypothetical protein
MSKLRYLLPGLVAALALIGCGETKTVTDEPASADLCVLRQIDCHDPTGQISCDPVDGVCKCGGQWKNGVTCGDREVCKIDTSVSPPSPTCVSQACDGKLCGHDEACDARDGECKCAGVKCGPDETCNAGVCEPGNPCAGIVCREGETCDPNERTCKCGDEICSVGQSCRVGVDNQGYCVGALCVGVNCAEGSECSPVDGLCHCGNTSGPACTAGQACAIDEPSGNGTCQGHDICEGVVCTGGTTCSPLDGQCRCGGYDAAAPICGEDQTCDQDTRRCLGGNMCASVICDTATNTSCDDQEGICKCGGRGGVVCGAEQGCIASLGAPACVTRCSPLTTNVAVAVCGQVGGGEFKGCYYSPRDRIGFCSKACSTGDGDECEKVTDCASGSHCVEGPDGGVCRPYCKTGATTVADGACYNTDRVCVPLDSAIPNLGVCLTVSAK